MCPEGWWEKVTDMFNPTTRPTTTTTQNTKPRPQDINKDLLNLPGWMKVYKEMIIILSCISLSRLEAELVHECIKERKILLGSLIYFSYYHKRLQK